MELNEYQKAAIFDESNACIVKAHVGSGKTTVLIAKILYLHEQKQIPYKDMMVLTFTNKAANEIKERLLAKDKDIPAEELALFGTFHSVALSLLKSKLPIEKLGYTKDFLVIEPDEELDMADMLIRTHKLKIKYKNRLKKRLEQVMDTEDLTRQEAKYQDDIALLKQLLIKEKQEQNKMTFSDLIKNAILLMDETKYRPKWIIVDEVQDSDEHQLAFIDKMKEKETCLFAVGDPNQVIYSWRGSDALVFFALKRKYEATEYSLPINYRSSNTILEAAGHFLEQGKKLEGIRDDGNKIVVKNHYNPFQEAHYLAGKIEELHKQGVRYQDIAIFYRLQTQSQILEDTFARAGIPYEVSVKRTVKDYPVLHYLILMLRYAVNPKDTTSGIAVLSNKYYGECFTNKRATTYIQEPDASKSTLLPKLRAFLTECNTIADGQQIYDYFALDDYLQPTAASFEEDKKLALQLFDTIFAYCKKQELEFLPGLKDFLNSNALYGITMLKSEVSTDKDTVKLMTLHAAKGLEFDQVFILGVNNGLIPLSVRSMEEAEEERRLFFVGITRAKNQLELSYYTNPEQARVMTGESRYLTVLPEHLLARDNQKETETNLQDLRRQVQALKQEQEELKKLALQEEVTKTEISEPQMPEEPETKEVLVRHAKYGIGKVVREDDMMIAAEFEQYGVKEFMKGFCELEYI